MPALGTAGCLACWSFLLVATLTEPSARRSMTPKGHPATQVPQPLQTSSCTTTVPNSVRKSAPVGHTSRQPACVQCLQTSDSISQRSPTAPSSTLNGFSCSMNATCRHVFAPSADVLSYDSPVQTWPSCGIRFHSL